MGGTPASGGDFTLADPVNSFVGALQRVLMAPAAFFSSILRRGDFVGPTVFALICLVIGGVLGGIISLFRGGGFGGLVSTLLLTPIVGMIGVAIWAGIMHLLTILLVKPTNSGFEATYRVSAYTAPLSSLVSWIPLVGPFIGFAVSLYALYLEVVGIREIHGTTTQNAALVVLIPAAILLAIGACLFITVGLAIVAVLSGGGR
jgi:hypothetical protein